LSESSFTCPGLQASGLVRRLFKSSVYTGFLFIKGLDRFHYITNMGTGRFGTCDKELQICLLPIWEQVDSVLFSGLHIWPLLSSTWMGILDSELMSALSFPTTVVCDKFGIEILLKT
jgi:hypothetical protein